MQEYFNNIYNGNLEDLILHLEMSIKNEKKEFIITANPEIIMKSLNDEELSKMLLDHNNIIVPDGISIVKTAKRFNKNISERITGIELSSKLIKLADKYHKTIYLFGSEENVVKKLESKIKREYANIPQVYAKNGYTKYKNKIINDIQQKQPDIILVALGVPLQEKIIYENISKFKKGIFVGVGGTFDVLSGAKKRAPKIFIKLNLEWLYRIIKEPKRLKRFYENNIKFYLKVKRLSKKERKKNNE